MSWDTGPWNQAEISACLGSKSLPDFQTGNYIISSAGSQAVGVWQELHFCFPGSPACPLTLQILGLSLHHCMSQTLQFSSVAHSCPILCDPMDYSTPALAVYHQLPEPTQTHVHRVNDAIQPSHPLSSPSPPAFNLSQHQGLFRWISASHQVAEVLEFQFHPQSFQWIFRKDFLYDRLVGSCYTKEPIYTWLKKETHRYIHQVGSAFCFKVWGVFACLFWFQLQHGHRVCTNTIIHTHTHNLPVPMTIPFGEKTGNLSCFGVRGVSPLLPAHASYLSPNLQCLLLLLWCCLLPSTVCLHRTAKPERHKFHFSPKPRSLSLALFYLTNYRQIHQVYKVYLWREIGLVTGYFTKQSVPTNTNKVWHGFWTNS